MVTMTVQDNPETRRYARGSLYATVAALGLGALVGFYSCTRNVISSAEKTISTTAQHSIALTQRLRDIGEDAVDEVNDIVDRPYLRLKRNLGDSCAYLRMDEPSGEVEVYHVSNDDKHCTWGDLLSREDHTHITDLDGDGVLDTYTIFKNGSFIPTNSYTPLNASDARGTKFQQRFSNLVNKLNQSVPHEQLPVQYKAFSERVHEAAMKK